MAHHRTQRAALLGRLTQVTAWVLVAAVVAMLALAVVVPRLGGATPYTILSGSMQPDRPPGTLVVVKPVAAGDIALGDVITYQLRSGRPTVVTHRVVGQGYDLAGEQVFTTQGDANDVADARPVRPVQVRGRLWYSVPYLGYANTALNGSQRQVAVVVVAGVLLAYAALMGASALLERRATHQHRERREEGVAS